MTFVVDANGHVSDAKAISGPPELFGAAVQSVKQWRFQPPINAPVSSTTINYGHPHPCPAATADAGYVIVSGPLRSDRGTVIDINETTDWPLPPYLLKERLASVSGEMVLAITVNARGNVTQVRAVKSLSPRLDKAAIKAIRKWRFKPSDGGPNSLPDVFLLRINYSGLCDAPLT